MTSLEIALRGGSISILLIFSILCFRFRREFHPLGYAALYSFCSAVYVYVSAWPIPNRMLLLDTLCSAAMCSIPAAFWLLMAALFDDEFSPTLLKQVVLPAMAALGAAEGLTQWHVSWLVDGYFAAAVGFFIAGSVQTLSGFMDDLIQGRRQFRIAVLFFAPLHAFAIVAVELLSPGASFADIGRTVNSWAIAISSAVIAILFLKPHIILAPFRPGTPSIAPPRDKASLDKLNRIMTEERAYRDEGLALAGLARRMQLSESRLRKLINSELGHRNFSAFVNGYRLAEAASALSDPAQTEVPILTIALDSGFGSIGPFNRAFKSAYGVTPREFRISASLNQDSARSKLPV